MADKTNLKAGCFRWQELQGKLKNKAQGRAVSCEKYMRKGGDVWRKKWKRYFVS